MRFVAGSRSSRGTGRRDRVLWRSRCHGTEAAGPRAVAPYVPRAAADTVLHGVVQEHLETFLAAAAARTDGVGLPHFIEREFRAFLRCGLLVHGFLRVRCDACAFERLVPLMKTGGFIPSVDHQTPPGVSLEQYRVYLRLLNEYTSNREM